MEAIDFEQFSAPVCKKNGVVFSYNPLLVLLT